MLFTGERIDAADALSIGLVDEVVSGRHRASSERALWPSGSPVNAPLAVTAAKRAVNLGLQMSALDGHRLEATLFASLVDTADFSEGVSAFLRSASHCSTASEAEMKIGVVHVTTEAASGPYTEMITATSSGRRATEPRSCTATSRHVRRASDTAIAYPTLLNRVDVAGEMVALEADGADAVIVACSGRHGRGRSAEPAVRSRSSARWRRR